MPVAGPPVRDCGGLLDWGGLEGEREVDGDIP